MKRTSDEILIRPARAEDRGPVLAFCLQTFEWGDYIGEVWDDWLADPSGHLVVAELSGLPVGVLHLAFPAAGQGWLQGLRVDPAVRRRGIATGLVARGVEVARLRGAAVVRFFTSTENVAMRQLAPKLGFRLLSTHVYLAAPAIRGGSPVVETAVPGDLDTLWELVRRDQAFQEGGNTYCRGWRAVELTREQFASHLAEGQVLVAREGGKPTACAIVGRRPEKESLWVSGLFGNDEALGRLAKGLRGYAGGLGAPNVELLYVDFPPGLLALADAGYAGEEGGLGMFLFALEFPRP